MNESKLENLPDSASFKLSPTLWAWGSCGAWLSFIIWVKRFLVCLWNSSRSIRNGCFIRNWFPIRSYSFVRIMPLHQELLLVSGNCFFFISIWCLVRICTLSCSNWFHIFSFMDVWYTLSTRFLCIQSWRRLDILYTLSTRFLCIHC